MGAPRTRNPHGGAATVEARASVGWTVGAAAVLDHTGLDQILRTLAVKGFTVVAPSVRDETVGLEPVSGIEDLPAGWGDAQEPGRYRLERRADGALFGYAVGPHSWKRYLYPPALRLWRARRTDAGIELEEDDAPPSRYALVGVRPCELAAIAVQDRVFLGGAYVEPHYQRLRGECFIVAVNCSAPAATCFCASLGTGPGSGPGFDLALTEVLDPPGHRFVVQVGSDRGAEVLREAPARPARPEDRAAAETVIQEARRKLVRSLETRGLKELLQASAESPRWEAVARRCLSCGSCTMACPTCFCATVEDVSDLGGQTAERVRRWDSCFSLEFSYIHGGSVRSSAAARYRQWLTHKLASWQDQFGTPGCVGCGRCLTWCPAAIDLTEEVRALRGERARGGDGGDRNL